ncbi:MAG: beta-galactosidase [Elusimicrobiota bacterium]
MLESDKSYFMLDGEPFYIFSGEMHYFRIEPSKWKLHLARAREAGLNTVSTYIPWSWHEYEENKYDFSGKTHPQRNIEGFLKEVKESGLYLTVRIGPFSNAELKGEGIPFWLTGNYPEVYSTGEGIVNLPHTMLISYINPVFRKFVKKWYGEVISVFLPYLASRGGNILLVQLCNEIGMIQWVNGRGDYSNEATEMYREYLKDKYSNIDKLAEMYPGCDFKDFTEIQQTSNRQKYGWQDFADWADFYRRYFADYYVFLYNTAKEKGIDIPVIANIPQFIDFDVRGRGFASPMTTSFYKYIPSAVKDVVFGGAYQMRRMDYENFHDVYITTQVVKTLTRYSNPVLCAELQTGILRDKPRLYASDVELNLKTSLASGVDGVNCYMFSGGENPDNIGMFGKRHQWQAPVDSEGVTDDKYEVLKEYGEFIESFGNTVARTKPLVQTTFGIYPPYYGTEFLSDADCGFLVYARNRYFFDGIGRLLSMGSTAYDVIDLHEGELDPEKISSMMVFSLSFMEEAVQKKLLKYVKAGGKLMLFPELPERDLSGNSCRIIADAVGVKVKKKIFPSLVDYGEQESFTEGAVSIVEPSGKYKVIATVEDSICSFAKDMGKGRFVFMGSPMPHYYDYHVEIADRIIREELGVIRKINIDPYDIVGFLRTSKEGSFLFLLNYHQKKYSVNVKVDVPEKGVDFESEDIHINSRSAKILPLGVKLDDRTAIRSSTVEVLSAFRKKDIVILKIKGCIGETARIILERDGKFYEHSKKMQDQTEEIEIICKRKGES